jgi:type IV pilus assembly protein PilW
MSRFVNRQHSRGFTLVEFMIAGLLGLVLLAGLIQIFLSASQSSRLQSAIAEVQDKGRTAMEFLSREVENAGFVDETLLPAGFNTLAVNVDFAGTADGGGSAPDSIQVQYVGARDCIGTVINGIITNRFDVVGDELRCNGQPLIDGVDGFQLLFGVDANGDGLVEQYMTANRVVGTGNQANVRAVRVAMLVASTQNVYPTPVAQNFTLLDAPAMAFNDRRLRRQFTTTVMIQNQP